MLLHSNYKIATALSNFDEILIKQKNNRNNYFPLEVTERFDYNFYACVCAAFLSLSILCAFTMLQNNAHDNANKGVVARRFSTFQRVS